MLRLRVAAALSVAATCVGALGAGGVAAPPAAADSVRDGQQQVLDMLNVPAAWTASRGQGATVAVLDSGVAPTVSDLAGSVISGPDLTGVAASPASPAWGQHGTWMASIIAGHGHDAGSADGVTGVAPEAKILSVRVIPDRDDPGYSSYEREQEDRVQDSLAEGIRYAVDHGADVISMSIGYGSPSAAVRSALQFAYGHGVAVVASSGNSGDTSSASRNGYAPLKFPADYPGVIGVAAVSTSGAVAGFSSDNLSVEVAAPGVNISAQGRDGQYWLVTGTSPACALVAGAAALIKARYPGLAPDLLAQALSSTTQFRPPRGYDQQVGFGTVDAAAALTAAGRLSTQRAGRAGVASAVNFGGGPASAAPEPVRPRGSGQLILFAVLALTALVLVVAAVSRLAVLNRLRRREREARPPGVPFAQAARPGYAASGPGYPAPGPGYPAPGPGYPAPGPGYPAPGPGYAAPGPGYPAANPSPSYPAIPGHPAPGPDRASASSD
jgi:subtilisin family serine protease